LTPVIDLRYPTGAFSFEARLDTSSAARADRIDRIAALPTRFRSALDGIAEAELDRPYRPNGWSLRQVAHHVPDSHLQGFVRFKHALTESLPQIKPYDQDAWVRLGDTKRTPIVVSLNLLDALHERWTMLLRSMTPEDFARCFRHPEHAKPISLDVALANYAWHGEHHTAHVIQGRTRQPEW
jgi:DinB superfamily